MTRRQYPDEEREVIPPSKWSFARVDGGQGMDFQGKETAIVSSDIHIHLPTTFQTGWIYELIYTAKDPLVMGLGHLVVRDAVSFLRYNKTSQNPFLKYEIEKPFVLDVHKRVAAFAISSIMGSMRITLDEKYLTER